MGVEYSRGFFPGWLNGVNHQELVNGTFSSHRGVEIGKIVSIEKNTMSIESNNSVVSLENGDGLAWFEAGEKKGGSIYGLQKNKNIFEVEFSNSTQISQKSLNSKVYFNHDKSQKKDIEKSITDKNVFKKIPVSVRLHLAEGRPLKAVVSDDRFTVEMQSEIGRAHV